MENFKILSYEEEKKLTIDELRKYYSDLKRYLRDTRYSQLSSFRISFNERLNKHVIRYIINKIKGYELFVDGLENIPNSPVIYASTHQDFNDHFNVVLSLPEHTIILNTNTVTPLFKFIMSFNGIIYVDRMDSTSRFNAKLEQMRCLAKGKSIVIFPEGTYNCSPNKLHLPLHKGVIDMARKMNVPIVPLVQEYTYDENIPTIKNVKSCHVRFGKPICVDIADNTSLKLEELSESFSSLRYELIEEKGIFSDLKTKEYINYVLSRIDAWRKINVSVDDERKTIYGVDADFYLFHHINDVAFDSEGNLLATPLVQKLEELNNSCLNIGFDRNGDIVLIDDVLKLIRSK